MLHPRLSINSLSSFRWSFDGELTCWSALGVRRAGVIGPKLGPDIDTGFERLTAAVIRRGAERATALFNEVGL